MKEKKSTKMFAEVDKEFYKLLKTHADDTYFLEVLYYYICRALIVYNYNLSELDGIIINGRFMGNKMEVLFSPIFNTILKSLSLAMSIRAIILNKDNINKCYNDRLLFYDIEKGYLSWDSHQAIMECIKDDKFRLLYEMIATYKNGSPLKDYQKEEFNASNIRPEYRNQEKYFKSIATDPAYDGKSVIKNNEYLYAEFEEFDVPKEVEYIGDTAFAYCRNLKTLRFTRKVMFGYFPIIECDKLKHIVVPTDFVDYYKQELPFYSDIISDNEDEIEHEHVDIPPVDSYIETEPDSKPVIDSPADEQEKIFEPINTKLLDTVFDKKATSYKYFWFLSIISLAKETNSLTLSYKDIIIRMAAIAWPIIFEDEIELGKSDMLPSYLKDIVKCTKLIKGATSNVVESYLKQHYTSQGVDKILWPLTKNVPYRFLSPWIPFTTNDEVIEKSNDNRIACPYAIHDDTIIWDEDWWEYIDSNYNDICKFALQSFINYVKKDNNQMKLLKLMTEGWGLANKY